MKGSGELYREFFNPSIGALTVAVKEQQIRSQGGKMAAELLSDSTRSTADGNGLAVQFWHVFLYPSVGSHIVLLGFFFIISYFKHNCNKNEKKTKKFSKKC